VIQEEDDASGVPPTSSDVAEAQPTGRGPRWWGRNKARAPRKSCQCRLSDRRPSAARWVYGWSHGRRLEPFDL